MSAPLPAPPPLPRPPAPRDALPTLAAIGLLAYLAADVAHHAAGHGAMCLISGGQVQLLSSIVLVCSKQGVAVDLAGPFANLACGVAAVLVLRLRALPAAAALFCALLAGFNLMWLGGQLMASVVTGRDDWAWLLRELDDPPLIHYGLMGVGALLYVLTVRHLAAWLAPFSYPQGRVWRIAGVAWLAAGAIAAATAAFDRHGIAMIWQVALPQSLLLSLGLLFSARRAANTPVPPADARPLLAVSRAGLAAAAVAAAASIALLGPGVRFA